jgi:AcrR family transcriptional regulator
VATRYRFRAHGYHGAMDAPGTSERARPHGAGRAQAGNGAGAVGPGRRLSADARRRQLFEVALALFAEHGYPSTTMDDIAEAAGVTKPLVYQHFDSKRALYLELMDVFSGELVTRIVKATATAEGPRQQVELGFAAYFELMVDNEQAFRLLYGRDAPDDPELGAALRRVEEVIAEAIDPLIDAGLDPAHRLLLARPVGTRSSCRPIRPRRRRCWPPNWPTSPGPACARSTVSDRPDRVGPSGCPPDRTDSDRIRRTQTVTDSDGDLARHHRLVGAVDHSPGALGGDGEGGHIGVAGDAEGNHARLRAEQAQ